MVQAEEILVDSESQEYIVPSGNKDEAIELEKIIVTPYSGIQAKSNSLAPYSTNVYTSLQISNTGASTVINFLKTVPELNISDYYGNGIKTVVDMMGFGDNANSNILILVNGRRVNNIDMSGVDWTQIPLENVDRIEIVKGGGVVLYGDNASGGVINIISKKIRPKKVGSEINFQAGSYRSTKESVEVSGGTDLLSFRIFGEYHSTSGYRQNSHYRSKYVTTSFASQPTEDLVVSADLTHHKYVYGLPDDITESESKQGYSRRDSTTPLNNARVEDNTLGLNIKNMFSESIVGSVDVFFRNKNELEELLSYSMSTDKRISNFQVKPQLLFIFNSYSWEHELITGFELYTSDLSADDSSSSTDIDRRSVSLFLQDDIHLTEKFSARLGWRLQKEKFTFDYRGASSTDDGVSFTEDLYELGLNYKFFEKTNMYLNFSRGLRVGKTDEYLVTWPVASINESLRPQRSKAVTVGINSQLNSIMEVSLDYFQMCIRDEIYYDPTTWENKNYDNTRRQGANINVQLVPLDCLTIKMGYRFIDAVFRKGSYSGKQVPFVPKALFTASVKYDLTQDWSLFVDYQYRGKVYLINDLNNIYSKLNSFNTTNVKLSYHKNNFEIFGGINNLFNEIYSEYAATNISGTTRGFYPSPERNYYVGIKLKF